MSKYLVIALSFLLAASLSEQEELCAEDLIKHLRETYRDWAKANDVDISRKLYDETSRRPEGEELEEFDFVIVGIGSAGSVLVNRLSKVSKWKVLALEAGDAPDFLSDIPVFAPLQQFTHHNWGYTTEKQDHIGLGFENQRVRWPRGKGLGGSSLIHYMFFTRCNKIDYDRWAKKMGNAGWSYENVLPYFKAMEDANLPQQDDDYRGKGGELSVKYVKFRTKCAELFVEAAKQLGCDYVDVNGRVQTGVEFAQTNTKGGFRCSGEKAFVRPVKARGNLSLRLNSHVTKILVDETTKTATGVEYVHKGKTFRAKAAKEVILCAGAIGSPHILMLSGVGPQNDLEKHGIQVVQNLPVGQKLHDHSSYVGLTFTFNESLAYDFAKALELNSFDQLHKEGSGPLESTAAVEALAFIKTNASTDPEQDYPDVELIQLSTHFPSDKGMVSKRTTGLTDQVYKEVYKPLENKTVWSIYPVLLRPKSFGRMELRSADPFIYPKLYANYLSDPEGHDLKTLVAGIREAIRIGESPIMRAHGSELVRTKLPGCKSLQFDSDDYWGCAVRHLISTMHHQTTTCKMGPAGDDEAVVDHRLRVHNVKNLRVADTSVIPIPLTGHTNAPAYMIGAKAAAMITEDWS